MKDIIKIHSGVIRAMIPIYGLDRFSPVEEGGRNRFLIYRAGLAFYR